MSEFVLFARNTLSTLNNAAGDGARLRFLEFFTANGMIRRLRPTPVPRLWSASTRFELQAITAYLKDGGVLENAVAMANHASTRTTQLYDRRRDEFTLEKIVL